MNPVIVIRGLGDRQGDDIVDPMIDTEPVAVARGTQEINESYGNRVNVTGSMPIVEWRMPGEVVEVTDMENGVYRAMVKRFGRTIDRSSDEHTATDDIEFERMR